MDNRTDWKLAEDAKHYNAMAEELRVDGDVCMFALRLMQRNEAMDEIARRSKVSA